MPPSRDHWAGLFCVAVGLAFAWGASTHEVGSAAQMGPGYFPLGLGLILMGLGAVMALRGWRQRAGPPLGRVAWRPLVAILAANLAFGLALGGVPALGVPPLGLVVATVLLVVLASLAPTHADQRSPWREVALLAVLLAGGAALLFVQALGLSMPLWPLGLEGWCC